MPWFLLFIPLLLAASTGTALYAGIRSARVLFAGKAARWLWVAFLVALSLSLFAGFALRENHSLPALALRLAGYGWLITLPYWLLATAGTHAFALANRRWRFLPVAATSVRAGRLAVFATVAVVAGLLLNGYHNHVSPVVTPATVRLGPTTFTGTADARVLRAAVASDFHMGDLIGRARVAAFVDKINAVGADIILLPGDLVDGPLAPVVEADCAAELRRLRAPLGVFAVLGNHDHDADAVTAYLRGAGIRVLRDEAVLVGADPATGAGGVWLAGRNDRGHGGAPFGIRKRAPLAEILRDRRVDRAKPLLVLDHQPVWASLREAAEERANLLIAGHTHGGQVWPVTWLVRALYEVPEGVDYVFVSDGFASNFISVLVTTGIGLWGFPARIGTRAEVVDLRLEIAE
ncbi:MAG: metallophosphoesterase [Puniceicoccales bacterium]|jgi:predicted MPP superfamily phosphohydrolase|nr:metallophosphoesterase [Puniceicoccales bacterium]